MHAGLLFIDSDNYGRDKCFITVPSTSLLNIGGVVGFNIDLVCSDDKIDKMIITELRSDKNLKLFVGESYEFKFKDKNPVLRKEFHISSN